MEGEGEGERVTPSAQQRHCLQQVGGCSFGEDGGEQANHLLLCWLG